MSTSAEQITEAIAALNGAADAYNGKKAEIDARIGVLAGEVSDVIDSFMAYTCTLDPTAQEDVEARVFNTFTALLAAAPAGSALFVRVPAGVTVDFTTRHAITARVLLFEKWGGNGGDPVLRFTSYVVDGLNRLAGFITRGNASIEFKNCLVEIADKADANLDFRYDSSTVVQGNFGTSTTVGVRGGKVTSLGAQSLVALHRGVVMQLALADTEFDGAFSAVQDSSEGLAIVAPQSVVLTNGAEIVKSTRTITLTNAVEAL